MTDVMQQLVKALQIIAAHEVAGPLTQNDDNVSLSDLPFYVAGKAHAELAILHNIARNALDKYEAAIAALHPAQQDGWQDIATAPKDLTRILVAAKHHGEWFVFEARWASGHRAWLHVDETSLAGKEGRGDFWQPLPAPPANGAQQDGWQDIATAPKDGTPLDLWVEFADGGHRWADGRWMEAGRHKCKGPANWCNAEGWPVHAYLDKTAKVTHFRPLPAPPANGAQQ